VLDSNRPPKADLTARLRKLMPLLGPLALLLLFTEIMGYASATELTNGTSLPLEPAHPQIPASFFDLVFFLIRMPTQYAFSWISVIIPSKKAPKVFWWFYGFFQLSEFFAIRIIELYYRYLSKAFTKLHQIGLTLIVLLILLKFVSWVFRRLLPPLFERLENYIDSPGLLTVQFRSEAIRISCAAGIQLWNLGRCIIYLVRGSISYAIAYIKSNLTWFVTWFGPAALHYYASGMWNSKASHQISLIVRPPMSSKRFWMCAWICVLVVSWIMTRRDAEEFVTWGFYARRPTTRKTVRMALT